MRILSILFIHAVTFLSIVWGTDIGKARVIATSEHKLILLNFSGSDWCGPCIRLHKEYFEAADFEKYAGKNLVLVNADFPRSKKNQLSTEQQKMNDLVADQYNKEGAFPLTLLLTAEGKVLKIWDGLPKIPPTEFVKELNTAVDANN